MNERKDVLAQVTEVLSVEPKDLRERLQQEIVLNALKCIRDDLDVLGLKMLNRAMAEYRYATRVFKPYRQVRKVSIFGSARTLETDPYFQLAVHFGKAMADAGYMVITGSGDGIMRAGIEGAGRDKSFGVNILIPQNTPNRTISEDPKLITFRYFFTRKVFFVMEADAFALFPGGFGTHDECFEILTLMQTGKAPPMPVVLMELPGETYWETWDQFVRTQLLARGYVSPEDLSLYTIAHSPEEGMRWIARYYSTYHSSRQVFDNLVVRLERALTDDEMAKLNEGFPDLTGGQIVRTPPLPQEADEPEVLSKPRIMFPYNRRSPGRLNQLVIALNTMGETHTVRETSRLRPPAG